LWWGEGRGCVKLGVGRKRNRLLLAALPLRRRSRVGHTLSDRDSLPQQGGCMYRSTRSFFVACALATLLSAGCREASEQATAHATGGAPAAAKRATGRANQEGRPLNWAPSADAVAGKAQKHTHDASTAPHTHGEEGVRLSATAKANLNLQVAEATTQTL